MERMTKQEDYSFVLKSVAIPQDSYFGIYKGTLISILAHSVSLVIMGSMEAITFREIAVFGMSYYASTYSFPDFNKIEKRLILFLRVFASIIIAMGLAGMGNVLSMYNNENKIFLSFSETHILAKYIPVISYNAVWFTMVILLCIGFVFYLVSWAIKEIENKAYEGLK